MLEEKINKAIEVIKDTLSKAKTPFVVFAGDKDSFATLHLVTSISKSTINVLFIDTSVHFNEIYLFVEKMQKLWGFNLIKERNREALKTLKIAQDKAECCLKLKAEVLRDAISKYNINYLFTGIRRDEQESRKNEEYISQKDDYIQVNPIVYFTEQDVWQYIRNHNLPYCSLYDKGYRSIDCMPCTEPALEYEAERDGRAKDKEEIMEKLRKLGYF